jgi:hypothetical protein
VLLCALRSIVAEREGEIGDKGLLVVARSRCKVQLTGLGVEAARHAHADHLAFEPLRKRIMDNGGGHGRGNRAALSLDSQRDDEILRQAQAFTSVIAESKIFRIG